MLWLLKLGESLAAQSELAMGARRLPMLIVQALRRLAARRHFSSCSPIATQLLLGLPVGLGEEPLHRSHAIVALVSIGDEALGKVCPGETGTLS